MDKYIPQDIEKKWQARWDADRLWHTDLNKTENKFYVLTMYPYPSGDLHMGHWYAMAPSDVRARYLRMTGKNVFFPIGFDAFGLPAENAAIKRGIQPYTWTMKNIENMRRQMHAMGASFDWEREVVTCDPARTDGARANQCRAEFLDDIPRSRHEIARQPQEVAAHLSNGVLVYHKSAIPGRVVVVGADALLEAAVGASGQRSLAVYAPPTATYTIQYASSLNGPWTSPGGRLA